MENVINRLFALQKTDYARLGCLESVITKSLHLD